MRIVLAKVIATLHFASILFLIFGWLLPLEWLIFHVVSIPLVILQWKINDDQCYLTQWQLQLEGSPLDPSQEGQFVKSLMARTGLNLGRSHLFILIYGALFLSVGLSLLRIYQS